MIHSLSYFCRKGVQSQAQLQAAYNQGVQEHQAWVAAGGGGQGQAPQAQAAAAAAAAPMQIG